MAYRDGAPVGAVFHGVQYLSYTIVLDDNWPSRRTAAKPDAFVCANSLVYRRNFQHEDEQGVKDRSFGKILAPFDKQKEPAG
jgi:hypothetical protein